MRLVSVRDAGHGDLMVTMTQGMRSATVAVDRSTLIPRTGQEHGFREPARPTGPFAPDFSGYHGETVTHAIKLWYAGKAYAEACIAAGDDAPATISAAACHALLAPEWSREAYARAECQTAFAIGVCDGFSAHPSAAARAAAQGAKLILGRCRNDLFQDPTQASLCEAVRYCRDYLDHDPSDVEISAQNAAIQRFLARIRISPDPAAFAAENDAAEDDFPAMAFAPA